MYKQLAFLLLLLVYISHGETNAQWEVAAGPAYKFENPVYGFELKVIKRLPFQFPDFGVKSALNLDQYYESKNSNINNTPAEQFFSEVLLTASIITSLHLKHIQPYAVLGIGGAYFNLSSQSSLSNYNQTIWSFLLSGGAGLKADVFESINPYVEIKVIYKTGPYASANTPSNRSAVTAALGINIKL